MKMKVIALLAISLASTLGLAQAVMPSMPSPSERAPSSPPDKKCNGYFMNQNKAYSNGQMLCYYASQLFTPSSTVGTAFSAEISQVMSSPPEWGQGIAGFARRFGTNYAQNTTRVTGTFMTNFAFHNDPRMFPSPDRGAWQRTGHAFTNIFAASPRNEPGQRRRFSPAWIIGSLGSGFIGNAWYPDSVNTWSDALKRSGTALGGTLGNSFYQEFGPDVIHWVQNLFTPKTPSKKGSSSRATISQGQLRKDNVL